MNIFLSHSGTLSQELAGILQGWLPKTIQLVNPFFSGELTKGIRWNDEIVNQIKSSKIGLICLTEENVESPWIMFEAGALSNNLDDTLVCPILFGISSLETNNPLAVFHTAKYSKKEMFRIVETINSQLGSQALKYELLHHSFDQNWSSLDAQVKQALKKTDLPKPKKRRTDRDLLEEILTLTRSLRGDVQRPILIQINGKYISKIHVPQNASKETVVSTVMETEVVKESLTNKIPRKIIYVEGRLVNVVI